MYFWERADVRVLGRKDGDGKHMINDDGMMMMMMMLMMMMMMMLLMMMMMMMMMTTMMRMMRMMMMMMMIVSCFFGLSEFPDRNSHYFRGSVGDIYLYVTCFFLLPPP